MSIVQPGKQFIMHKHPIQYVDPPDRIDKPGSIRECVSYLPPRSTHWARVDTPLEVPPSDRFTVVCDDPPPILSRQYNEIFGRSYRRVYKPNLPTSLMYCSHTFVQSTPDLYTDMKALSIRVRWELK